ncbi:MAG TPA: hypothetical protein VG733_09210, partial [Chthoniobacteraceae bacterium]|nr:hypothetical protein [Chthoniobacteraceae bacterium]
EPLLAALRKHPEIREARLGQKQLKHVVKQRVFLLCIRLKGSWFGGVDREKERQIINALSFSNPLPGRSFVFAPRESFARFSRKLSRIPGTKVEL